MKGISASEVKIYSSFIFKVWRKSDIMTAY